MLNENDFGKLLPKNNLKTNNNITVLYDKKIAFIRVSRVASTNIHFSLLFSLGSENINLTKSNKKFRTISSKFQSIKNDNWLTFSFIRDPIERFKSAWWFYYSNQSKKHTENICKIYNIKEVPEINKFVEIISTKDINLTPRHLRPQWTSYIYNNKILVDCIFKLENLRKDIDNFAKVLKNKDLEFQYIEHKSTTKKEQNIELSNSSIYNLKKIFEIDFDLYNLYEI